MTAKRTIYRVSIPEALHAAVDRELRRRSRQGLTTSDAVREALAAWIGKPALAESRPPGRPKTKAE